jgi:hypothetical protein
MQASERIETLEEYELIRSGLFKSLPEQSRNFLMELKQRLKFREEVHNRNMKDKAAAYEYHRAYDELMQFDKSHGFMEIAKQYAKTQAFKHRIGRQII